MNVVRLSILPVLPVASAIWLLLPSLIGPTVAVAQDQSDATCILGNAKNGQTITVQGEAVQQPHDLGFRIVGCDDLVLVKRDPLQAWMMERVRELVQRASFP